ncbi:hypothetical protein [Myxacorys almedinensis]|uniref:Uncharacterized protein n=1 Tax=Myxacorys almedinensis A TaxID=2690445 RepID=A0A8J8CGN6_9CYAN|nr:hypothetical protein [Myxacorys almedinensis]NDJ15933.1 hypothetical protein [Myxacorys almedinensis A]
MRQPHASKVHSLDPTFQASVHKLHEVTVLGRWLVAIALWLTIGLLSLWGLREPIALLQEYFTWSALRYGLAYHPLAAMGLGLCIGVTVSILLWQSRNILFGIPKVEQKRLEERVLKIRQQGSSHPLWRWIK